MASPKITFRLTEEEDREFRRNCERQGLTPSDALRKMVAAYNKAIRDAAQGKAAG